MRALAPEDGIGGNNGEKKLCHIGDCHGRGRVEWRGGASDGGAGAGWNFTPYVGALIQTNYNSLGINSSTLSNLGAPGGGVHVFSATLDPVIHLHPRGHFDPYIVGGGGLYHEYQNLTAQTVVGGGYGYGFGGFGYYPGEVILSSYSVNKPGANIGAGISLGTKWHAKFYAEARWNHVFGTYNGTLMDFVPATFGVRW